MKQENDEGGIKLQGEGHQATEYTFIPPPPAVGYWNVCNQDLHFNLTKRPSKWNQFWCAYLIGWKWTDI